MPVIEDFEGRLVALADAAGEPLVVGLGGGGRGAGGAGRASRSSSSWERRAGAARAMLAPQPLDESLGKDWGILAFHKPVYRHCAATSDSPSRWSAAWRSWPRRGCGARTARPAGCRPPAARP